MSQRPKLPVPSQEMRRISVLLSEELMRWPAVTERPMFGLRAFYRKGAIFAMLPGKRAFETPDGIGYKLPKGTKKWQLLELRDERDIANAIACLEKAYRNN